MQTLVAPGNHVLDGVQILHVKGQFCPMWARRIPFPLVHSLPNLLIFFTLSFFIRFMCVVIFPISSVSTRTVPLCFQAGGPRRPNLGLVFVLILCYLYFLVKDAWLFFCCIWFGLVLCDRCLPQLSFQNNGPAPFPGWRS